MDRGFEIVTPLLLPEAHIYVSGGRGIRYKEDRYTRLGFGTLQDVPPQKLHSGVLAAPFYVLELVPL